jgi:hypothetical protein
MLKVGEQLVMLLIPSRAMNPQIYGRLLIARAITCLGFTDSRSEVVSENLK